MVYSLSTKTLALSESPAYKSELGLANKYLKKFPAGNNPPVLEIFTFTFFSLISRSDFIFSNLSIL